MVIRETPDGGGRMGSFMRRFPGLGHQPDIVLEGFDGRDSYTILEVKTCEPAGDAWIARQHTDTSRGAAHRYLERTLAPGQYTIPAHQPGAPRLRLLTFAVSVRGALGSEAQTFIRQLSARMAGAVPYRLLDEASWATQGCAPPAPLGDHLLGPQGACRRHPSEHLLRCGGRLRSALRRSARP